MATPTRADIQAVLNHIEVNDIIKIDYEGTINLDQKLTCPDFEFTFMGKSKTETIFYSNLVGESILSTADDVIFYNFRLNLDNNSGWGIYIRGEDWLIHDIIFNNDNAYTIEGVHATAFVGENHPRGVIYNCRFNETRVLVYGSSTQLAHNRWNEASAIGTANNVFVEDCEFYRTFGSCIDSNYGACYVFRYNTIYNCYAMTHSVQGANRASKNFEVYGNTFVSNNGAVWTPFFFRGGTGVVFNNTATGNWQQNVIALDNVRCFTDVGGDAGLCDGDSIWDSNEEANGWLGRDQIGSGPDSALSSGTDDLKSQAKEPAYFWNNTKEGGAAIPILIHNSCGPWIQLNRDYYESAKPAYSAYTYPHPSRV